MLWPYLMVVAFNQTEALRKRGFFRTLFFGLPFLILSIFLFVANISNLSQTPEIEWYPLPMILLGIFTGFAVGFREESVFRGIQVNIMTDKYLKDRKGIFRIVAISSFFFGIMHMSNMIIGASFVSCLGQSIYAFGVGTLFAAMYLRGDSLWALIFIHGLYDTALSAATLFTATYGGDMLSSLAQNQEETLMSILTTNLFSPIYLAIALFLLRKSKCEEIIKKYESRQ